jgi:hypothetical protein
MGKKGFLLAGGHEQKRLVLFLSCEERFEGDVGYCLHRNGSAGNHPLKRVEECAAILLSLLYVCRSVLVFYLTDGKPANLLALRR